MRSSSDRISLLINAAQRLRTVRDARQHFLFLWAMETSRGGRRVRRNSDAAKHSRSRFQRRFFLDDDRS
jgi:hypothetical protein